MTDRAPLGALIHPCGPVVDAESAERVFEPLIHAADVGAWRDDLEQARPALTPVFAASPYLSSLARRRPEALALLLSRPAEASLARLIAGAAAEVGGDAAAGKRLRQIKADAHLLIALADLGGVWSLDQVTDALTRLADACVVAALAGAAAQERGRGRLLTDSTNSSVGTIPGFFILALGKHGAGELNYSSDIDVTAFFEPEALPVAAGHEPQAVATRLIRAVSAQLQDRTGDGYVFRVDLRLRPDPGLTPPAVTADAALEYYESVGQNWERAAFIKARHCAGDSAAADRFLRALRPYIWRRSLDFSAIEDVKAVKQQIHAVRGGEETLAPGADLKLGRGGIREIEFFAQTQQLILGGRDPSLRSPRTLEALAALAAAGHVSPAVAEELTAAYTRLRTLEHRVQMLRDEHTHRLPVGELERRAVAAFVGEGDLGAFDAGVSRMLQLVNRRYGELFAEAEPLSVPHGSLVFTGVDDDPETLRTLERMGFTNPAWASGAIRDWHRGRTPATASERGRELFTRLAPRLLEAVARTGSPDIAFQRFASFFSGLRGGVQVQALLLAQPNLLDLLVRTLAYAPRLAAALARGPSALDSLLDADFFAPLDGLDAPIPVDAGDLETAMNAVRRAHRERSFRVGMHILTGRADGGEAGRALSDLADACIAALAPAAFADVTRVAGGMPGAAAVLALGKAGSREMTFGSDLDLMLVHDAPLAAVSKTKGWAAETWYGRACQRLVAALSVHTAQGGLYAVDLRLRPTGSKGPVAVPLSGFASYYAGEAETWELMALTRARVVWSSDSAFAAKVAAAVDHALRQSRDAAWILRDARVMRALVAREKPTGGAWDLKFGAGGLLDIEFAAQALQLAHADAGGPLTPCTGEALKALCDAGWLAPSLAQPLLNGWRLQSDLTQVLRVAFTGTHDPSVEPDAFKALLAQAGGHHGYDDLAASLVLARANAHAAWLAATEPGLAAVEAAGRT